MLQLFQILNRISQPAPQKQALRWNRRYKEEGEYLLFSAHNVEPVNDPRQVKLSPNQLDVD